MPAPTTTAELFELIRKSELLPAQRLDTFLVQATAATPSATPKEMAALFVAAGILTQFQADQFLQGKWRGFTIGKYRVLERLGAGGMGTVYLCEHVMVGRRVAVKVLPTAQAANPSILGRFYREARASGALDHPNLVKCHDIDQDGNLHFLVMDYADGANLQEIVARSGPLSPERTAHYVSQAALGLQHAHGAGLIHRDVKPANILVERNGTVRVLDMGLARFFHDNTDLLTLKYDDNNVLGTADYVAPEQALNSHEVDVRADVYSLGATAYFCLTGQPPFPTGKVAQKLIWHQVRQPTPIRELRPNVPPGLIAVVNRMMAKAPTQRYQVPGEVVEALAPWTTEPIAPPSEAEMPRLSPAIVQGAPSFAPGPRTPAQAPRPTAVAARARSAGTAGAGRALEVAAQRSSSSAERDTPRTLGALTPTKTDQPRTSPAPVVPSQRLAKSTETPPTPWLRVLAILSGGALVGLAVRAALGAL